MKTLGKELLVDLLVLAIIVFVVTVATRGWAQMLQYALERSEPETSR
jgi:hypothetical protein